MKPLLSAIGLVSTILLAQPAQADDRPASGGYVLVDTVLDGIAAGYIVPIFTHMTLDTTPAGGRMEFTFMTSYGADSLSCSLSQKCDRAVNALGLDFIETDDGRITVTDVDIRTGPGMTIDRPDFDDEHIIQPMLALVDGAQVTWTNGEIKLAPEGWPNGRTARFLAGDRDAALDALAFALQFELSLRDLDSCVIRQLMEIANGSALFRSEADREILQVAHIAGLLMRIDDQASYWSTDPDGDSRDPDDVQTVLISRMMLQMAISVPYQEGEVTADAVEEGIALIRTSSIQNFDAIRAELILPNLAALGAVRRYHARYAQLLYEGYDPVTTLCRSVYLDM